MNTPQRIVLVVGAIALLVMLATVESYQRGTDGIIFHADYSLHWKNIWDWRTAAVRGLMISGATAAIYFAVGKRKK